MLSSIIIKILLTYVNNEYLKTDFKTIGNMIKNVTVKL